MPETSVSILDQPYTFTDTDFDNLKAGLADYIETLDWLHEYAAARDKDSIIARRQKIVILLALIRTQDVLTLSRRRLTCPEL